jgi:hypothetical protein
MIALLSASVITDFTSPSLELTRKLASFGTLSETGLALIDSSEAEAYCWQSAGTVIPGVEPRWDPCT